MAAATTLTPYQKFQQAPQFYNSVALAVSYLPPKDQVSAALTNRSWRIAIDRHYGPLFKECIANKRPLFLTDSTHKRQQVQLKTVLGRGGCKIAFDIGEGRALLLPQQEVGVQTWRRVVREELGMTDLLTSYGLCTPLSRPVLVSPLATAWNETAYVSESFANLGVTKGWQIIDFKNLEAGSTWIRGTHFLFNRPEDRLVEKNWDAVFEPLLADVVIYAKRNPPINWDSINLVIIKNPSRSPDALSPYSVRFFGFDFSSKNRAREIPKKDDPSRERLSDEGIRALLTELIDCMLWTEFSGMNQSFKELKQTLVETYTKAVLSRL